MATSGGEVSGPTQEWFDAARDVAVFDLDVVYETPAFCPGWLLPLDRQGARVPVTRSNLPVVHGGVLTADIVGREAELALYYARLPALPPVEMQSETARWNCFDVGVLLQAARQAAEARRRMAVLQPLLSEAVGRDLWIARGSG